jgi:hypothetical protein
MVIFHKRQQQGIRINNKGSLEWGYFLPTALFAGYRRQQENGFGALCNGGNDFK